MIDGPSPGEHVADSTPALVLGSPALDLDHFECGTSSEGPFETCAGRDGIGAAPLLPDGDHVLTVQAVDVRANADREAPSLAFTVDTHAPELKIKGRKLKLNARGKITVKLKCKRTELTGPCRGKLALKAPKGVGKVAKKKLKLEPGKAKRLKLKVKPSKLKLLERNPKARIVRAQSPLRDAIGNKGRFRSKKLKIRLP